MSTATVEVLTAEVRTLMVGSRQVTLSVYRQLDWVPNDAIQPFGRVRADTKPVDRLSDEVQVVGVSEDGALVRSRLSRQSTVTGSDRQHYEEWELEDIDATVIEENERHARWKELPLIVLAGLR